MEIFAPAPGPGQPARPGQLSYGIIYASGHVLRPQCKQQLPAAVQRNANMRHTRIFYKERRHRAGCKVCTVALALCFIGLVVAMAHGRRGLAPTDICQLRAICHNHAAWLARPVPRPVRHFEVGTQAHAYLGGSISRRPLPKPS